MPQELIYQDLITRIAAESKADYDSDIQPPATEEALLRLSQKTQNELGADLPESYLNFLRLTDGLIWDGLFIYSSEKTPIVGEPNEFMHPFVDTNLIWRSHEPHKKFLFFGDGDVSLYVYNLAEGHYEILDRPSETVIQTFPTFDEMLTEALRQRLHENEDDDDE